MAAKSDLASLETLVFCVGDKISTRKDPNLPYIGLEDFQSGSSYLLSYSPASLSVSTNSVYRRGDVLFGKLRPNLRKAVAAPFDGYCSTDILVLRILNGTDPSYAAKVFQSEAVMSAAIRTAIGTRMPRTSWVALKGTQVFAPPLPEQRLIAQILDTVDETIRKTEQLITKLKLVKQGLLHDLLTRGIDDNGELRDPERHPEQFEDSPLGMIPREWTFQTLGESVLSQSGFIQTGPFGSQLHADEYVESSGIPVVMPQDLDGEGKIRLPSLARVSEAKAVRLSRHRMQRNDVVFSRRGDLSRCAAVREREAGWLCGTGCLLARLPESLDCRWVSAVYRHDRVQRQVTGRAVGSTMPNLNTSILAALDLALPSADELREIGEIIDTVRAKQDSDQRELAKLRLLKSGLMDDLLTGRVRVTPLLEESSG